MLVNCKCWMSLNTGPNGECEVCGLIPHPDRFKKPKTPPNRIETDPMYLGICMIMDAWNWLWGKENN